MGNRLPGFSEFSILGRTLAKYQIPQGSNPQYATRKAREGPDQPRRQMFPQFSADDHSKRALCRHGQRSTQPNSHHGPGFYRQSSRGDLTGISPLAEEQRSETSCDNAEPMGRS